VMYMSGQDADGPDAPEGPTDFLHKPFAPRELTDRVRRALAQPLG
jgi:hypothetical protein